MLADSDPLATFCESLAELLRGSVRRTPQGFAIDLAPIGRLWIVPADRGRAKITYVLPAGMRLDYRIASAEHVVDPRSTRPFDVRAKMQGAIGLYQEQLRREGIRELADPRPAPVYAVSPAPEPKPEPDPDASRNRNLARPLRMPRRKENPLDKGAAALKKRREEIAAKRMGMAHWAPEKEGRPPTAFFYIRWSSLGQSDGTSEEVQTRAIEALYERECAADFARAPRAYSDSAKSGWKIPMAKRPWGGQLLKDVQKGDIILVHRSDRMFRNSLDAKQTLKALWDQGVRVRIADGPFKEVDMGSATGRLIFGLLSEVAEFESSLKSERVRESKRIKIAEGAFPGGDVSPWLERAKYKGRRHLLIRPEWVELLAWCAERLRAGDSYETVALAAKRKAARIAEKPTKDGGTYGLSKRSLERGLGKQLKAWHPEKAKTIEYQAHRGAPVETRYVWALPHREKAQEE